MSPTVTSSKTLPSALAVATTQNTAPVVEYRCLYTHDLRRKQKRWQDGFLRFHTFNKRVMVYDVPRNYIGDTHWRDSNLVQDGDEFELDRGVLIQVGEETGSVDQDLSGLLEKRKKAPDLPVDLDLSSKPKDVSMANVARSYHSQALRPKPLNAVLQTPKGSIGRASLPLESPYDQRTPAEKPSWQQERSTKRLKLQTTTEKRPRSSLNPINEDTNQASEPVALSKGDPPVTLPRTTPKATETLSSRPGQSHIVTEQIHQMRGKLSFINGQADASKRLKAGSLSGKSERTEPMNVIPSDSEAEVYSNSEDEAVFALCRMRPTRKRGQRPVNAASAQPVLSKASYSGRLAVQSRRQSSRPITFTSVGQDKGSIGKPKARGRLQMASRKPGRKLMYRELLPPGTGSMLDNARSHRSTPPQGDDTDKGTTEKGQTPRSLSSLHQAELGQLEDRRKRSLARHSTGKPPEARGRLTEQGTRSSNEVPPLHCREERSPCVKEVDRFISRPGSKDHSTDDILTKMDEVLISKSVLGKVSPKQTRPPEAIESAAAAPSAFEKAAEKPSSRPPKPSETQVPSSPLISAQPAPQPHANHFTAETTVKRPNDTHLPHPEHTDAEEANIPSSQPLQRSPPTAPRTGIDQAPEDVPLLKTKPLPTFKQPTPRSPLKKTLSDISSMRPAPEALTSRPSTGNMEAASGKQGSAQMADPWSKEIWDLFGCGRDGMKCSFAEFVEQIRQRQGMG